jgi:Spy/CpxP family protein refolding chaperone
MKYFSKIRLAWFFVILLSAVNITLMVAYFTGFHHYRPHHLADGDSCRDKKECMLRSELNLDSLQTIKYDQIKKDHHLKARPIVDSLRSLRTNLMSELKKDTADSTVADRFVQQINGLNNRLFELSIVQYLEIKKILNPNQKEQLSKVYCDMFGCIKDHKGCGNKKENHKSCEGGEKGCE